MRCAVQVWARVIAQGGSPDTWTASARWLQRWLPVAPGTDWEVDLCRHLAEHAWWAEQPEAAIGFAERACSLADSLGDEGLFHWCRHGKADLLVRSGRSQEARELLTPPESDGPPHGRLLDTLRWASVLRAMRDPTVSDWLAAAYVLIEQSGYSPFREVADALASEL